MCSHRSIFALLCQIFVLLILGVRPLLAGAEETPSHLARANAALLYWQAFAFMQNPSDQERTLLMTAISNRAAVENRQIDKDATTAFINQNSLALDNVNRALLIPKCDWELDYSLGMKLPLPHFSKLLTLTQGLALRARLRVAEGKEAEAMDDLCHALEMSRHAFQNDKILIAAFVQISMESTVLHAASTDLSKFHPKSLKKFLTTLDSLPPRLKISEAIASDGELMFTWLRNEALAIEKLPAKKEKIQALLKEMVNQRAEEMPPYLANLKTVEAFRKAIDASARDYAQVAEMATLPYREAVEKVDAFCQDAVGRRNTESPLSALFLPSLTRTLSKEMQEEMQVAMMRAAIAIRLHGPKAIASIQDPFTGEPFEYQSLSDEGGGFRLTSKGKLDEKPISMTFR